MVNLVVVDDGSRQIKITDLRSGVAHTDKFYSNAILGCQDQGDTFSDGAYETEEGDKYTVVKSSEDIVSTVRRGYQMSSLSRVFVHEALRRAGYGGEDVILAVTMPINQYYLEGEGSGKNELAIEKKQTNLTRGIINKRGHKLANIIDVVVFPEAIPAFIEVASDQDDTGKLIFKDGFSEGNQEICCIDIGGYSIDIAVFESQTCTIRKKTSKEYGVSRVIKHLHGLLSEKTEAYIPLSIVEKALEIGKIEDLSLDITQEIEEACRGLITTLLNELDVMAPALSISKFQLIGGGSNLNPVKQALLSYVINPEKLITCSNPDELVSRGALKLLRQRELNTSNKQLETA